MHILVPPGFVSGVQGNLQRTMFTYKLYIKACNPYLSFWQPGAYWLGIFELEVTDQGNYLWLFLQISESMFLLQMFWRKNCIHSDVSCTPFFLRGPEIWGLLFGRRWPTKDLKVYLHVKLDDIINAYTAFDPVLYCQWKQFTIYIYIILLVEILSCRTSYCNLVLSICINRQLLTLSNMMGIAIPHTTGGCQVQEDCFRNKALETPLYFLF